jgi:hypothetical protein
MVFSLILNLFFEILDNHYLYLSDILEKLSEKISKIYDFVYSFIFAVPLFYIIVLYGLLRSIFGIIIFIKNIKNKNITFRIKYILLMIPLMLLFINYILEIIHYGILNKLIIGIIIFIGSLLWLYNWFLLYNKKASQENIFKGYEYIYILRIIYAIF